MAGYFLSTFSATLCLKKPSALLGPFTQANIHSLDRHLFLTGHMSAPVLCAWDTGVKAIVLALELIICGASLDVHRVT